MGGESIAKCFSESSLIGVVWKVCPNFGEGMFSLFSEGQLLCSYGKLPCRLMRVVNLTRFAAPEMLRWVEGAGWGGLSWTLSPQLTLMSWITARGTQGPLGA